MPKHYNQHAFLPQKENEFAPNFLAIERTFSQIAPVCVTASGLDLFVPAGTPGTLTFIEWQPTASPLNDYWKFIGPAATTNIRSPADGYYDFWFLLQLSNPGVDFAVEIVMQTADTSSTGMTSPTWTNRIFGPSHHFHATFMDVDNTMEVLYRGLELRAHNMVRFGVRMHGSSSVAVSVQFSEFRFTYPIPHRKPV